MRARFCGLRSSCGEVVNLCTLTCFFLTDCFVFRQTGKSNSFLVCYKNRYCPKSSLAVRILWQAHHSLRNPCRIISTHPSCFCSINAVGVDIAPFSAMPDEAEVLLLPGLPLVNCPGENPEKDLWTFEIETPGPSILQSNGDSPSVMIDYVHPGAWVLVPRRNVQDLFELVIGFVADHTLSFAEWNGVFGDVSWRCLPQA